QQLVLGGEFTAHGLFLGRFAGWVFAILAAARRFNSAIHGLPFRQHWHSATVNQYAALAPVFLLFVAYITVFFGGSTGQCLVIANHGGATEDQQVGVERARALAAQGVTQNGYAAQQGHAGIRGLYSVTDQTTEHHGLPIGQQYLGFNFALVGGYTVNAVDIGQTDRKSVV